MNVAVMMDFILLVMGTHAMVCFLFIVHPRDIFSIYVKTFMLHHIHLYY